MARYTTRLGRALVWWAENDGESIPEHFAADLRRLTEPCPMDGDAGVLQLNEMGQRAMRAHGYTGSNTSGWSWQGESAPLLTASTLGQALKRYRGFAGRSQGDIAEEVGRSATYISMLETGRRWPSMRMLDRLARASGATPSEVLALAERLQRGD